MKLTIRQLIDELRAASEVVGADAEVEGVESVMTTTRSVKLDDGGKSADLEKEIEELEKTHADEISDLESENDDLEGKIKKALALLRSDANFSRAAVIKVLE